MASYLALHTLHVGDPGRSGEVRAGTVFDPGTVGLDGTEVRRLLWREFISESDAKPADDPVTPHQAGPPEDARPPARLPAASGPDSAAAPRQSTSAARR